MRLTVDPDYFLEVKRTRDYYLSIPEGWVERLAVNHVHPDRRLGIVGLCFSPATQMNGARDALMNKGSFNSLTDLLWQISVDV